MTTFTINGKDLGRIFQGIGGVTSNGMTKLLREYPAGQREDMLDLLFKPKFGASFQVLKVEIGSDANGTCGTEPSHMRSATDYDITRGVGLWLAQEAKKRNPNIILDAIRWGTPAWVTDNDKKYLYYKNFLTGARDKYGLKFNYLAPDENEGMYSRNWVIHTLRPRLNQDGFADVVLSGADSTEDWNIAPIIEGDPQLKEALGAINIHYREYSPQSVKDSGLPIFASENLVAFRHKFSCSLDMAYKIIRSYASGRMVQYQMHPIIEAIYDNVPYTCKSLLTAAHPWSGHYCIESAMWVTAHFTQFIHPGWQYLDGSCASEETHSYLTLKNPATGDFSTILLNQSEVPMHFSIKLENLQASIIHAWMTTENEYFVQKDDVAVIEDMVQITLPPMSICTLTTTTGQTKGVPAHGIPEETSFRLPYHDGFELYEIGKQPRYTVDQSGAFEVHPGGKNGKKCLKQVLTLAEKPIDWERRATPEPYTILGGQELKNYCASFDFYMEPIAQADYEGYVMLGVRCNFSPAGDFPADSYGLYVFLDGRWQLRYGTLVLKCGYLEAFSLESWHSLRIVAQDDLICGYYDDKLIVSLRDTLIPSGHVVIGSGYHVVRYSNFSVTAIDETPECLRYQESDPRIHYQGSWKESGSDARNYMRTLLVTNQRNDSVEFRFNGTAVSVLGILGSNCGKADVFVDEEYVDTIDTYFSSTQYRKSLFSAYRLRPGDHSLRLVVQGEHSLGSSGDYIQIDAVEVSGGAGLIKHTDC